MPFFKNLTGTNGKPVLNKKRRGLFYPKNLGFLPIPIIQKGGKRWEKEFTGG
jgi:hypothetical protein